MTFHQMKGWPLAKWTDCFQLGLVPKGAALWLLAYANMHFLMYC